MLERWEGNRRSGPLIKGRKLKAIKRERREYFKPHLGQLSDLLLSAGILEETRHNNL